MNKATIKTTLFNQLVKFYLPSMILNRLHVFKSLYECGSTAKAAESLHVTRSAISQNLTKLESELGASLFTRTPKGLNPTSIAHELADSLSPLLNEITETVNSIKSNQSINAGMLNIGAPPASGAFHMPKIIEAYNKINPNVEINLTLADSHSLSELVLSGKLDLAIIDVFGGVSLQREFHAFCHREPLIDEYIVMLCSANYYHEHIKGDVSFECLSKQDFLSLRKDSMDIKSWFHYQFNKTPLSLKKKLTTAHGLTILECAHRDLGLFVSGSIVTQNYVNQGEFIEITPHSRGEPNHINIIQLLDKKQRIIEKEFIKLLKYYAKTQWIKGL
ncbi:LysR family transcriptional regulator [Marinomonas sp. 2405UD68-3]|uniref:LysR family transcriptional regulator n=1 Tax=Marinomonas sp. 2405UD68-3 TaxID=3391835 RepID=UPI0039C99705